MKISIVITLLAMFAILQACQAIPVRIQEDNIDVRSAVAHFVPPVHNAINIPHSELKSTIHSEKYPAEFLNSFIYPYGPLKRRIKVPSYLDNFVSGHERLHHPYPIPVVIRFPVPHFGHENLIPPYLTTIGSSDESSSDSSDESIISYDEILLQTTTTTTTTEPTYSTVTISTTEKPTRTVSIVTSSETSSSKASSEITEDSNISSKSSQSSESLKTADSSS